jgi:hypothetical protein
MTMSTTRDAVSYARGASKQELIAEAIACIISGRPYPEHLAPTTFAAASSPAASCEEGIGRILAGPAALQLS